MKPIKTTRAPQPVGPYSQAIMANGFLFISGQLPVNPENNQLIEGGIEQKTEQVMRNAEAILEQAGSSFSKVVKTTIFVKNLDQFTSINAVYGSFFEGIEPPARECVEVSRLPMNADVEISITALL